MKYKLLLGDRFLSFGCQLFDQLVSYVPKTEIFNKFADRSNNEQIVLSVDDESLLKIYKLQGFGDRKIVTLVYTIRILFST